jgi:DNA topoisomerase IB
VDLPPPARPPSGDRPRRLLRADQWQLRPDHAARQACAVRPGRQGCAALPGQHLFQYLDESGRRHSIDSTQINEYLHRHLGGDFTAKDFRTWHATLRAYELLLAVPRPEPCTDSACRRELKKIVCEVAAQLRNTPAVCRKSYINPLVLTAWEEGRRPFDRPVGKRHRGVGPLLTLLK